MKKKIVVISIIIAILIIFIFCAIYIKSNYKKQKDGETDIVQNIEKEEVNIENEKDEKVDEEIQKFEWKHDTAENHNMNNEKLENFYKEIGNHTDIYGALVIKDDNIIGEYYKEGYNQDSIFTLQSCSKSVTSSLIGIAIDKGYIRDVNVPISEYFPEILESNNQNLKEITIWHLLTHTSGLNMNDTNNWNEWRISENWVDYILSRGSKSKPGTRFDYSTGNSHLLSVILQKATGMTAYDFGKKYLFEPLGMESVKCELDPQGYSDGGNGFSMNVYDMAKFGRLFLNKGEWEGKQIISQNWIEESTKVQFDRKAGSANYGYQWWVRTFGSQKYDAYFAQGHWGQFIFVIPEINLMVVFTSHHEGSTNMYWNFVNEVVSAYEG